MRASGRGRPSRACHGSARAPSDEHQQRQVGEHAADGLRAVVADWHRPGVVRRRRDVEEREYEIVPGGRDEVVVTAPAPGRTARTSLLDANVDACQLIALAELGRAAEARRVVGQQRDAAQAERPERDHQRTDPSALRRARARPRRPAGSRRAGRGSGGSRRRGRGRASRTRSAAATAAARRAR